jgi:predicted nucleic acid-binding protein
MLVVLDCSMTMAWLFEDEKTKKSEQLLTRLAQEDTAIVPAIWTWEVSNVLLVAQRRKRITRSQASGFLSMLKALPIKVDEKAMLHAHEATYELALEQHLSAYDASYLEIALRRQLPIATLDKKLNQVATDLGLTVV